MKLDLDKIISILNAEHRGTLPTSSGAFGALQTIKNYELIKNSYQKDVITDLKVTNIEIK